jgi:hypothetical protein
MEIVTEKLTTPPHAHERKYLDLLKGSVQLPRSVANLEAASELPSCRQAFLRTAELGKRFSSRSLTYASSLYALFRRGRCYHMDIGDLGGRLPQELCPCLYARER